MLNNITELKQGEIAMVTGGYYAEMFAAFGVVVVPFAVGLFFTVPRLRQFMNNRHLWSTLSTGEKVVNIGAILCGPRALTVTIFVGVGIGLTYFALNTASKYIE
jgi:hypothetical protein